MRRGGLAIAERGNFVGVRALVLRMGRSGDETFRGKRGAGERGLRASASANRFVARCTSASSCASGVPRPSQSRHADANSRQRLERAKKQNPDRSSMARFGSATTRSANTLAKIRSERCRICVSFERKSYLEFVTALINACAPVESAR